MSELKKPSQGFFFASFLYHSEKISKLELITMWKDLVGPSIEFNSHFCPMKKYYAKEMGDEQKLERFFLLSTTPFDREEFVALKLKATELEIKFSDHNNRVFNFDVGLLTLENFILATGKSFSHRTYIGQGVYADLNLLCEGKVFRALPWTYPDYQIPEVIDFLNWGRSLLLQKLTTTA